jgi:hypothetical protein
VTDLRATISSPAALLPRVGQVAILVEDLDTAIPEHSAVFPITRWRVYRYGPDSVRDLTFRGAPATLQFWVALSDTDPQVELIQSIEGPSLYTEWLEQHGHGFHHVACYTDDLPGDVRRLTDQGLTVTQSGHGYGLDGDGGFAYFDTLGRLGVIVELIAIPARRRPPDREFVVSRSTTRG